MLLIMKMHNFIEIEFCVGASADELDPETFRVQCGFLYILPKDCIYHQEGVFCLAVWKETGAPRELQSDSLLFLPCACLTSLRAH